MIGISILHSCAILIDFFFGFAKLMLNANKKKKNGKFENKEVQGLLTKIISSTNYWQTNKGNGKMVMCAQQAYKQIQKLCCICFVFFIVKKKKKKKKKKKTIKILYEFLFIGTTTISTMATCIIFIW